MGTADLIRYIQYVPLNRTYFYDSTGHFLPQNASIGTRRLLTRDSRSEPNGNQIDTD